MLGLGAYESSSEDEADPKTMLTIIEHEKKAPRVEDRQEHESPAQTALPRPKTPETSPHIEPTGPVLGPSQIEGAPSLTEPSSNERSSPFTESRNLIHNMTLPPVPNLDIPPSPPGSPGPMANAKFAHFLSLKKQGVHFNEKLAGSTYLKNPSLLKKLMDHAGIDDQAQYRTSLPIDVWNTSNLPKWGFKEDLLKSQQDVRHQAEETRLAGQRDSVEFVTASSAGSSRPDFFQ